MPGVYGPTAQRKARRRRPYAPISVVGSAIAVMGDGR